MASSSESVSFTINADSKPAVKAIQDLQKELKDVGKVKSVDKGVNKQQAELKRILAGVNTVLDQNKNKWALYDANVTRVKNLTAALDEQKIKTQNAAAAFEEFTKKQESGYATGSGKGDYFAGKKVRKRVDEELTKELALTKQLEDYKNRVAKVDAEAEQALKHILGTEKEIVRDESSLLGYKIQDRTLTEDTAKAEGELADKTKQTNDGMAQTAENARRAKDAIQDATKTPNKGSGTPIDMGVDTTKQKLEELRTTIIAINTSVGKIGEKMANDPATENIAELVRRYRELATIKKQIEGLGLPKGTDQTYATVLQMMAQLNGQIKTYKNNLNGVSAGHRDIVKSSKQLKSVPSLVSTISKGFKDLHRSTSKARNAFNSMARSMKSNLKHMITSITKYVLGFRSLFFLVRRLRRYIGEGIKNMAQFNGGMNHVNSSITRLLSSLLFLKNAWATAFSPILQFVTPWLEALIDKIAEAGNAFSRFLGSLLGQTTVFQAVKVKAADYADSLDNVGGSASGAADKTKKLTDRLAAFDDLNVLGVDKDPDKNGGGGGGGYSDKYEPNPNDMFKLVEAESQLAELLKQAWESGDFSGIGAMIKDKIVGALEDIDWDEIKSKVTKFTGGVGSFLEGLFGDPQLYESLGKTIGEAFNTFNLGIEELLKHTKNINFGENLGKGINEFLKTNDFEKAGKNVNEIITQITDNVKGLAQTLNSDEVAQAIVDFISGVDIGKIMTQVEDCVLEIGQLLLKVTGRLIIDAGEALGDKWYKEASEGIETTIDGQTIVLSADIQPSDDSVMSFVDMWYTKLGEHFSKPALKYSTMFLNTIWEGGDFSETDMLESFNLDNLMKGLSLVFDGTNGVEDYAQAIGSTKEVTEEDLAAMSSAYNKTGLDISAFYLSASDDLSSVKVMISEKLGDLSTLITDAWETIKGNVATKLVEIKAFATQKWQELKDAVYEKAMELKDKLEEAWTNIKSNAYTAWVMLRISMVQAFDAIKEALKKPINGIISIVEGMINKVLSGINSMFSKLNSLPDIKISNPFNGKEYTMGFNLPQLNMVSIPRLAQGAVIPPNREFMAVLGDQSHGTNVEAPLDTIKQAVAEVLANNGNAEVIQLLQDLIRVVESKNLTIGDKEIGKANARYVNQQRLIRGTNF